MILGRFATKGMALDLGDRLSRSLSRTLKRMPDRWAAGLLGRLNEIRAEHARENDLPAPPLFRPSSTAITAGMERWTTKEWSADLKRRR